MHRTTGQLAAGIPHVGAAPADRGTLDLIVSRPAVDERVVLEAGELAIDVGLVGDTWQQRGSRHTDDGSAELDRQLTIMSARAIALIAGSDPAGWPPAGDQLFVDLDLSDENLPAGTRLAIGTAVVEVTPLPHTGCAKFVDRFGMDAARFVNSTDGTRLRLRGINARVVVPGTIRAGDRVTKVEVTAAAL